MMKNSEMYQQKHRRADMEGRWREGGGKTKLKPTKSGREIEAKEAKNFITKLCDFVGDEFA